MIGKSGGDVYPPLLARQSMQFYLGLDTVSLSSISVHVVKLIPRTIEGWKTQISSYSS